MKVHESVSKQLRSSGSSRPFARIQTILAAAAAPAAVGTTLEAADTFDSGTITTNNLVGFVGGVMQESSFGFTVTQGRNFGAFAFSNTNINVAGVGNGQLASTTFKVAYDAARGSFALKLFSANQTFGTTAGKAGGYAGFVASSSAGGFAVDPERQAYFLFKFEDNGTVFNGWIDVDIRVTGGTNNDNYIRINRYAWQSSNLGVLAAGVTPVPEPSTVVTSGIAALTGGAVALRRWRKERKTTAEAA